MRRLFGCTVQLVYKDEHGERFVNSPIATRGAYWWNTLNPSQPSLWDSTIELGWDFYNEIIRHPVPFDMNTLKALKRCSLGLDLIPLAHLPDLRPPLPSAAHVASVVPSVWPAPGQRQRQAHRP